VHDTHFHSCGDCESFVSAFPVGGGPDDWGYCRSQRPEPPPAPTMAALEQAYRSGDRAALRRNEVGLYRTEPEDACDLFRERAW